MLQSDRIHYPTDKKGGKSFRRCFRVPFIGNWIRRVFIRRMRHKDELIQFFCEKNVLCTRHKEWPKRLDCSKTTFSPLAHLV